MADMKERLDDLIADLKQQRDELRLKGGLAKLEAQEEWQEIEANLRRLEAKAKQAGSAGVEASKDVGAAAKLLGEEIRKGFKAVAARLK